MDTANNILMAVPQWSFFFIGPLQIWNQGPAEKHGVKNREYKYHSVVEELGETARP